MATSALSPDQGATGNREGPGLVAKLCLAACPVARQFDVKVSSTAVWLAVRDRQDLSHAAHHLLQLCRATKTGMPRHPSRHKPRTNERSLIHFELKDRANIRRKMAEAMGLISNLFLHISICYYFASACGASMCGTLLPCLLLAGGCFADVEPSRFGSLRLQVTYPTPFTSCRLLARCGRSPCDGRCPSACLFVMRIDHLSLRSWSA